MDSDEAWELFRRTQTERFAKSADADALAGMIQDLTAQVASLSAKVDQMSAGGMGAGMDAGMGGDMGMDAGMGAPDMGGDMGGDMGAGLDAGPQGPPGAEDMGAPAPEPGQEPFAQAADDDLDWLDDSWLGDDASGSPSILDGPGAGASPSRRTDDMGLSDDAVVDGEDGVEVVEGAGQQGKSPDGEPTLANETVGGEDPLLAVMPRFKEAMAQKAELLARSGDFGALNKVADVMAKVEDVASVDGPVMKSARGAKQPMAAEARVHKRTADQQDNDGRHLPSEKPDGANGRVKTANAPGALNNRQVGEGQPANRDARDYKGDDDYSDSSSEQDIEGQEGWFAKHAGMSLREAFAKADPSFGDGGSFEKVGWTPDDVARRNGIVDEVDDAQRDRYSAQDIMGEYDDSMSRPDVDPEEVRSLQSGYKDLERDARRAARAEKDARGRLDEMPVGDRDFVMVGDDGDVPRLKEPLDYDDYGTFFPERKKAAEAFEAMQSKPRTAWVGNKETGEIELRPVPEKKKDGEAPKEKKKDDGHETKLNKEFGEKYSEKADAPKGRSGKAPKKAKDEESAAADGDDGFEKHYTIRDAFAKRCACQKGSFSMSDDMDGESQVPEAQTSDDFEGFSSDNTKGDSIAESSVAKDRRMVDSARYEIASENPPDDSYILDEFGNTHLNPNGTTANVGRDLVSQGVSGLSQTTPEKYKNPSYAEYYWNDDVYNGRQRRPELDERMKAATFNDEAFDNAERDKRSLYTEPGQDLPEDEFYYGLPDEPTHDGEYYDDDRAGFLKSSPSAAVSRPPASAMVNGGGAPSGDPRSFRKSVPDCGDDFEARLKGAVQRDWAEYKAYKSQGY